MTSNLRLINGDCLDVMREMDACSVDSIVTDPPYALTQNKRGGSGDSSLNIDSPAGRSRISTGGGFMGKEWDSKLPGPEIWTEALRVAKPGAYLLAFGGTRTHHRLACAIEDAGWEICDCIMWVFGSGFPKSLNISKAIDKAAGVEREVVGQKQGKRGQNLNTLSRPSGNDTDDANGCGAYGTGAKQITCDIDITAPATDAAKQWDGWGTALKPAYEPIIVARKPLDGTYANNVTKHGVGGINIDGCRVPVGDETISVPQSDPSMRAGVVGSDLGFTNADKEQFQAAQRASGEKTQELGRWPANLVHDGSDEVVGLFPDTKSGGKTGGEAFAGKSEGDPFASGWNHGATHGDSGSAARFFYCSKVSTAERAGTKHPTVKPIDLMRWLVRLVTPKNGTTLDPFMGSGSTIIACHEEGMNAIGIEKDEENFNDAEKRIKKMTRQGLLEL